MYFSFVYLETLWTNIVLFTKEMGFPG